MVAASKRFSVKAVWLFGWLVSGEGKGAGAVSSARR